MSKHHRVNVITRTNNQLVINSDLRNRPELCENVGFVYSDLSRLNGIQEELCRKHRWAVVQSLQHGVYAYYNVLTSLDNPGQTLELDACSHYARARRLLVLDCVLLDGSRPFGRYSIPEPAAEFIYEATKLFDAKKKDPASYLPHIRSLWEQDEEGAERHFRFAFGDTGRSLKDWISSPPEEWAHLREAMLERNRFRAVQLLQKLARVFRRVLRPTGMHITLLGSDGSGKSTLIDRTLSCMKVFFRRLRVYHFRPRFFEPPDKGGAVSELHGKPPYGLLRSTAKIGYYFIDYWVAFLLKLFLRKIERTLIIFYRDFDDLLVDPMRYRLAPGSIGLVRLLHIFLPNPDITYNLDIPPDVCHVRKPELPIDELQRQRAELRKLAERGGRYVNVSADRAPDEVASLVARRILKLLYHVRDKARAPFLRLSEQQAV